MKMEKLKVVFVLALLLGLCFPSVAAQKEQVSRTAQVNGRLLGLPNAIFKAGKLSPEKTTKLQTLQSEFGVEFQKAQKYMMQEVDPKHPDYSKSRDMTPEQQKSLNKIIDQEYKLLGVDPKTIYQ
jgi:hypothetical protein